METDELAQHVLRVSKDALAVFEQMRAQLIRQDAEMAELRDEVHALANRVESLTRYVAVGLERVEHRLHSVKVGP